MIDVLTKPLVQAIQNRPVFKKRKQSSPDAEESEKTFSMAALRKVMDRASVALYGSDISFVPGSGLYTKNLSTPDAAAIGSVCNLYTTALNTLTQIKLNILTGLCRCDILIHNLWNFISSLDESDGLFSFLDHISLNPKTPTREIQILILFCSCTTHLVT